MKDKKGFLKLIFDVLTSWGGDTPSEAIWVANDMIKWYENETGETFGFEWEEDARLNEPAWRELYRLLEWKYKGV